MTSKELFEKGKRMWNELVECSFTGAEERRKITEMKDCLIQAYEKREQEFRKAIESVIFYVTEFGDFRNGVTDSGIDEGVVNAEKFFKKLKQQFLREENDGKMQKM